MRRLIMPMAMSMCRITLRQLFIMHQLMAIKVEVLLTLVIMVIHQEEYIVILTELTIQIMYHNLLIILKKLNLWRRKEDMAENFQAEEIVTIG